jgi:uncharacterized protein YjbI with pentapeptide repeats
VRYVSHNGAVTENLRADCSRCFGLCCVAPAFAASSDFAVDKPAGTPCVNLLADFRCGIHDRLRDRGFSGCTVYDCFGAGQRVAQETFGGRDWRAAPETADDMFAVFSVTRDLHELLWYLTESLALPAAAPVHKKLRSALEKTERLAGGTPEEVRAVDVATHRQEISELLLQVSELVRTDTRGANLRGADLIGRDLRGADLRGANLRGAYLIGAELTGADLSAADVIGADLRGARLAGANLATSLFLTQFQVNAAKGDGETGLPATLTRPPHWSEPAAHPSAAGSR